MSKKYIALSDLSQQEQVQYQNWINHIVQLANMSIRPALVAKPPRFRVLAEVANKPNLLQVFTDGQFLTISYDLLSAPFDLRRYLIAHELGHIEGRHPLFSTTGGFCAVFGFLSLLPYLPNFFGRFSCIANAVAATLMIIGFIVLIFYSYTMVFEWDADRRGNRMIGLNAMFAGMALKENLHGPSSKSYYDNKRSRLSGNNPSIWTPRI